MCDNQTPYSEEFLQQVEELKKEIIELLQDKSLSKHNKTILNASLQSLSSQKNLKKTFAKRQLYLGLVYEQHNKLEKAINCYQRVKKEYDLEEEFTNHNLNITWPSKRKRGKGIINYLNGYRFEGNFKKGKANGDGIIYDGNGEVILEGNFTEGLLIAGILYKDECTYKGQFKNGTFDKYGECKYNHFDKKILEEDNFYIYDGIKYQGGWKNGEKSGDGIMVYEYDKNNKMKIYYTGQWENDKKNGNGKLYYGDLDYYECTWENNLKEGSGKKYKNGKLIFEGNWSNDLRSGNGISYNENGTKLYEGEWLNNKKNGKGKLYYDDGDYYDGNFVNDKRNGYGIVYSKGKIVCSGNFVEDNYQYGKSEPKKKHC